MAKDIYHSLPKFYDKNRKRKLFHIEHSYLRLESIIIITSHFPDRRRTCPLQLRHSQKQCNANVYRPCKLNISLDEHSEKCNVNGDIDNPCQEMDFVHKLSVLST